MERAVILGAAWLTLGWMWKERREDDKFGGAFILLCIVTCVVAP